MPRDSRRPALALLAAILLLSAACSLAPRYERPPAPVPPVAGVLAGDGGEAALPPWRDFLPEARLRALVEAALRQNKDLALASLRVREAMAQYGVAASERLPTLEAEGGVEYAGGGGGRRPTEEYEIGASIPSFEIDLFQRAANMSRASREMWLASVEEARMARLGLLASVAGAYLDTRLAHERLKLAERTLSSLKASAGFVNERIISGQSSLLDLERARGMVAFAMAELADRRLEISRSESALKLLLGDFGDVPLPGPTPMLDWPDMALPEGLSSAALLNRPDIIAAEHELMAAHADIGAARAAFLPRLSLTGFLGLMSMELASLFDPGTDQWSWSPTLSIPIFAGGRNRANLELAEVRREMSVVSYEKAIQEAFREVHEGLAVRALLSERVEARRRYLSTQRRALELASGRYQSGSLSYLDVLEAQREVFDAEMALLEARREALFNDLSLYVALGGGFPEEPPTLGPEPPEKPAPPAEAGAPKGD
jgi:Cu(I)/Ag(I) efflux system outer membrane protein